MAVLQIAKRAISGSPTAVAASAADNTAGGAAGVQDSETTTNTTTVTDTATGVAADGKPVEQEEKEIKMVIQGPLSHVYTKALQAMYALEEANVAGDGPSMVGQTLVEDKDGVVSVLAISDNDLIGKDEGVAASGNRLKLALDQLSTGAVLAVECVGIMTQKKADVLGYLDVLGVSVVHSPAQLGGVLRKRIK